MAPLTQASAAALARLRAFRSPPSIYSSLPLSRRAAVLLLLFADRHGNLRVLLTLRSSNLNSYAGQVSLPGGKADSLTEPPFVTARREASEEIGLPVDHLPPPYRVEHLCEIPTHLAVTEHAVRPCIAFLHTDGSTNAQNSFTPGSPVPSLDSETETSNDLSATGDSFIPILNATEVAAVFSCPFHRFISARVEQTQAESPVKYYGRWVDWNDVKWRMHDFFIPKSYVGTTKHGDDSQSNATADDAPIERNSHKLWGLTARMLIDSARIAYDETPEFDHDQEIGEEAMMRRLWEIGRLKEELKRGSVIGRKEMENVRKEMRDERKAQESAAIKNKL